MAKKLKFNVPVDFAGMEVINIDMPTDALGLKYEGNNLTITDKNGADICAPVVITSGEGGKTYTGSTTIDISDANAISVHIDHDQGEGLAIGNGLKLDFDVVAKKTDIPSIEGLATTNYVDNMCQNVEESSMAAETWLKDYTFDTATESITAMNGSKIGVEFEYDTYNPLTEEYETQTVCETLEDTLAKANNDIQQLYGLVERQAMLIKELQNRLMSAEDTLDSFEVVEDNQESNSEEAGE